MLNYESNVSGYSKSFPAIFEYSKNDILRDIEGKEYIDFFSGAGALNYGQNNSEIKKEMFQFLESDAPIHCLDMNSLMKNKFLTKFNEVILKKRQLNYKIQFPSPSGTNAVEAAVKLARKITQRSKVVAFTNSFHGMTATSLALSGCRETKYNYIPSQDVIFFPYDQFMDEDVDTINYMEKMITSAGSGIELPAAVILETIQAEGGINIASDEWLQKLRAFTQKHDIILIVDDIQVGCGRTGTFFSFEKAKIYPDLVLLSKSISGLGLPLSLLLIKPEFDVWSPGEHTGTFRANNLSLCTASKALDYWQDDQFMNAVQEKAIWIEKRLKELEKEVSFVNAIRGRGMIWGIEFANGDKVGNIVKNLFEKGVIIETCGNKGQVIKLLPPLTIEKENLFKGLDKITEVIKSYYAKEEITTFK